MAQNLFATGAYFIEDEEVKSLDRLEGILNHVHYVRDKSDQRSASEKKKAMTATRRLYRDFLFFKNFVALGLPLIVCEGKTDNIYLRAAIRNLGVHTGVLRGMDGKLLVRFLNHESKSAEILQLEGGTGALKFLFRDYKRNLTEFSFAPLEHPVIVLIDNDSGASQIFGIIEEKFQKKIELATTELFYHVGDNLYLVKTPELNGGKSSIEHLFDESLLKTKLGDKVFNHKEKIDTENEFGKAVFAEKIVVPNASSINFAKFTPLLDRLAAVIVDYHSVKAKDPIGIA